MDTILLNPIATTNELFWPQLATGTEWELQPLVNAVSQEQIPNFEWAVTSSYHPTTEEVGISDLHEDGYTLLQQIRIVIEPTNDTDFTASFREANIAIGGVDRQDAYQAIVAEILDAFD